MGAITREPIKVGEVLQKQFLNPFRISQTRLAQAMGINRISINRLCNGHRRLTVKDAISLSELFETTPDFWLDLQVVHDRWEARQASKNHQRLTPIMRQPGRKALLPQH